MDSPYAQDEKKNESMDTATGPRTITSTKELPSWDVVLNDVGQDLGGRNAPKEILILGKVSDQKSASPPVYVVATPEGIRSSSYTGILLQLAEKGYSVADTLLASSDVLMVVLSEFNSTHTKSDREIEESISHKWWDDVAAEAYRLGASDIHLLAKRGRGDLLYVIDGEIESARRPLTEDQAVSYIGSMYNTMTDPGTTSGELDMRRPLSAPITRRLPGIGTLRLRYESHGIEPSGLSLTLRLIPLGAEMKRLLPAQLGYSPDQAEDLERMFSRSSGIVLFAGPTGSGKSTSMAHELMGWVENNPGKMLRTVEEPVEIIIPGTNVSQASINRGNANGDKDKKEEDPFLVMLRSLLRSAPDAIMAGEIRDGQTANLAIQAARSGHFCVSTLHADGATIAFGRLEGMGIHRIDLASVGLFGGIIFQRLVPLLCEHCKQPAREFVDKPEYAAVLGRLKKYMQNHRPDIPNYLDTVYLRHPDGCDKCRHKGVKSRTACAEILMPTLPMLAAIRSGDSVELVRLWRKTIDPKDPSVMRGRTAFEHGGWKMVNGLLSPLDVERKFHFLDEESF